MPISAHFTVDGVANPGEHIVAYGATVNLALTSITAADVITWQVLVASEAAYTVPTITPAGTPVGSTASFTFPADPGDDVGRSFRVRAIVSNGLETDSEDALIGAANINGIVPLCPGEEFERHATHGWGPVINALLAGGAGTPVSLGGDVVGTTAASTVVKINGASVTTAGAASVGDVLQLTAPNTLGYAKVAAASIAAGGAILGQALIFNGSVWAAGNDFGARNLVTTGMLAAGATTVTGLTVSAFTAGVLHANASGVVSSSLIVNADVTDATIAVGKLAVDSVNRVMITDGSGVPTWSATVPAGNLPALAGDATGPPGTNTVVGLTGTTNVVAMHGTSIVSDAGAPGALQFSSTGIAVPGKFTAGPGLAKVVLGAYPGFEDTYGVIWLGNIVPSGTNYAFFGDGVANTLFNSAAGQHISFRFNHTTVGMELVEAGLRIATDGLAATERLEVVGNATATGKISANSGGARAVIGGETPGAAWACLWLAQATPSNGNAAVASSGVTTYINSTNNVGIILNLATNLANFGSGGCFLGPTGSVATERLEVEGNIKLAIATAAKLFQQDNATNGATAAALTVQAANATGTTSTGGALNLTSGTGSTTAGSLALQTGGTTRITVAPSGVTVGTSAQVHQIVGGVRFTYRAVAGDITLDATTTDLLLGVDTTSARSITMPTPASGRFFLVQDETGSAGTNNITLVRAGSEKIGGVAASRVLATNWGSWIVWSNGTDWFIH